MSVDQRRRQTTPDIHRAVTDVYPLGIQSARRATDGLSFVALTPLSPGDCLGCRSRLRFNVPRSGPKPAALGVTLDPGA